MSPNRRSESLPERLWRITAWDGWLSSLFLLITTAIPLSIWCAAIYREIRDPVLLIPLMFFMLMGVHCIRNVLRALISVVARQVRALRNTHGDDDEPSRM